MGEALQARRMRFAASGALAAAALVSLLAPRRLAARFALAPFTPDGSRHAALDVAASLWAPLAAAAALLALDAARSRGAPWSRNQARLAVVLSVLAYVGWRSALGAWL